MADLRGVTTNYRRVKPESRPFFPESESPRSEILPVTIPSPHLVGRQCLGQRDELRSWRTRYRGPLVIHAAAKVDSRDARHFGLDPESLVTSAFVGFAILSDVRPYTIEDAKLQKEMGGLRMVSAQVLVGLEEAMSYLAGQS